MNLGVTAMSTDMCLCKGGVPRACCPLGVTADRPGVSMKMLNFHKRARAGTLGHTTVTRGEGVNEAPRKYCRRPMCGCVRVGAGGRVVLTF